MSNKLSTTVYRISNPALSNPAKSGSGKIFGQIFRSGKFQLSYSPRGLFTADSNETGLDLSVVIIWVTGHFDALSVAVERTNKTTLPDYKVFTYTFLFHVPVHLLLSYLT